MDDSSWMYQNSLKKLPQINYCNELESFINYALSNMKNINGDDIGCLCKRCKNKKFLDLNVITMHPLQTELIEKCLY